MGVGEGTPKLKRRENPEPGAGDRPAPKQGLTREELKALKFEFEWPDDHERLAALPRAEQLTRYLTAAIWDISDAFGYDGSEYDESFTIPAAVVHAMIDATGGKPRDPERWKLTRKWLRHCVDGVMEEIRPAKGGTER